MDASNRFFVVPRKRYLYRTPKGGRLKGDMRKDRKTSPFTTFWFCDVGGALASKRGRIAKKAAKVGSCRLALRADQIPVEVLDAKDPRRTGGHDRRGR